MRILATLDGSVESKAVIPALIRVASSTGAQVVLLTVAAPVPNRGPGNTARAGDQARELLADFAFPLTRAGLEVRGEVIVSEEPAESIAEFAARGAFDLIAMATHGSSGLRGVVLGSVAAAVVAAGVVPVLLIRPRPRTG